MTKLLTRRAREYFEIFDELYDDGYIPHEIWQTLNKVEQESQAKMTVRLVEDTLIEHGYSKGCSNEQKKYRKQWLQDRGLTDIDSLGAETAKADPIVGAVEAFKKRIENEANERADQAIQDMQVKLNNIKERYDDLEQEHQLILNERNIALNENAEIKNTKKNLEDELLKVKQQVVVLEKNLQANEKRYQENKEEKEDHHNNMMKAKDETIGRLSTDIEQLRKDYKQNISEIKEQSEKQRHELIAKNDALMVENKKISKELHNAEIASQKINDQHQIQQKQLTQLKSTYNSLNEDYKQQTNRLIDSEKNIASLNTKISELQNIISDEKRQKQNLQEQLLVSQEKIGAMLSELEEKKRQLNKLQRAEKKGK